MEDRAQPNRALSLLKKLAPDNQRGNRKAHQRIAALLAEEITVKKSEESLNRLKWHLEAAGNEDSPEMAMAWGRYFLATSNFSSAQKHLSVAVKYYPELLKTMGDLETFFGNKAEAVSYFKRSQVYLNSELSKNPRNERTRVDYAYALAKTAQITKARQTLEEGRALDDNGKWEPLLASLMIQSHDLKAIEGRPITELFATIGKALEYDPNHGAALNRLMGYSSADVKGNVPLKTVLARVIADGKQPALAHLAMGNLCWLENNQEQALFHFEFAAEMHEDMAVLLNNLAWLIAHDEEAPDYERAMALIDSAIEQRPDNRSFLDTRGTIYYLKKEWKNARKDLELALNGVQNKQAVHQKLAVIYSELDLPEVAQQHELLSKQD